MKEDVGSQLSHGIQATFFKSKPQLPCEQHGKWGTCSRIKLAFTSIYYLIQTWSYISYISKHTTCDLIKVRKMHTFYRENNFLDTAFVKPAKHREIWQKVFLNQMFGREHCWQTKQVCLVTGQLFITFTEILENSSGRRGFSWHARSGSPTTAGHRGASDALHSHLPLPTATLLPSRAAPSQPSSAVTSQRPGKAKTFPRYGMSSKLLIHILVA